MTSSRRTARNSSLLKAPIQRCSVGLRCSRTTITTAAVAASCGMPMVARAPSIVVTKAAARVVTSSKGGFCSPLRRCAINTAATASKAAATSQAAFCSNRPAMPPSSPNRPKVRRPACSSGWSASRCCRHSRSMPISSPTARATSSSSGWERVSQSRPSSSTPLPSFVLEKIGPKSTVSIVFAACLTGFRPPCSGHA